MVRTLQVAVAALALAIGPLLSNAAPALATSPAKGEDSLQVRCGNTTGCQQWSMASPDGVTAWQDDKTLTVPSGKETDAGHLKISFDEKLASDGTFESITIKGQLDGSITGGGQFRGDASIGGTIDGHLTQLSVLGSATFSGSGDESTSAGGGGHVRVDCESGTPLDTTFGDNGGAGSPDIPLKNIPLNATLDASGGDCGFTVDVNINGGSVGHGDGVQGTGSASVDLTISAPGAAPTPSPSGCGGPGSVSGHVTDGHGNDLTSIQVQLYDGPVAEGSPVATDRHGRYCLPADPSTFDDHSRVRATLVDADHTPPIFETDKEGTPGPVFTDRDVTTADIGRSDFDIDFAGTPDEPWLGDVANIHWQSQRFVDWLLDEVGLPAAILQSFKVLTFASSERITLYRPSTHEVVITTRDSPYSERDTAASEGPENDEWHEISHHVANQLGIATGSPQCQARVANHGGWINPNTCDSLSEGFAMWLPTVASLDIDAASPPGYATPDYGGILNLEDNGWSPWDMSSRRTGQEDFAVAQLLWDLADDTPTEDPNVYAVDATGSPLHLVADNTDQIALGGIPLLELLAQRRAQTVVDVYQMLSVSPAVPAAQRSVSIDLNGDSTPDVSAVAAEFLAHNFHPVEDPTSPYGYLMGDPVARTDHVPAPGGSGLVARSDVEPIPNSIVRLSNTGSAPETFMIDVTYPTTRSHFDVPVGPATSRDVELELPFYWMALLPDISQLPACGAKDQYTVTLTISAAGTPPRTLDNCEYYHDMASATSGAAITYSAAGTVSVGSPSASGAGAATPAVSSASGGPTPIVVIVAIMVVVIAAVGLAIRFGVIRRRRGA